MKKVFILLFCLILSSLFSQSYQLYIKNIEVSLKKENGQYWDALHGPPDIKILVFLFQNQSWKNIFFTKIYHNLYKVDDTIRINSNLTLGSQIAIRVLDQDITEHDLIGDKELTLTKENVNKYQKMSFGLVLNFEFIFLELGICELEKEHWKILKEIEQQLATASEYMKSIHTASSAITHIQRSQIKLNEIKNQVGNHPQVQEVQKVIDNLNQQMVDIHLNQALEKVKNQKRWYESALERKENHKNLLKRLQGIEKVLEELKANFQAHASYLEFQSWLSQEKQNLTQQSTKDTSTNVSVQLHNILTLAEEHAKKGISSLPHLIKLELEARSHVEVLKNEPVAYQELLEKYVILTQTIQKLKKQEKPQEISKTQQEQEKKMQEAYNQLCSILNLAEEYYPKGKDHLSDLIQLELKARDYIEILKKEPSKYQVSLEKYIILTQTIQKLQQEESN